MISIHLPVGLIADDLTGACDTGVQFAKRGLHSTVWFEADAIDCTAADLLILSSDSRADDAQIAMAKVDHLCRELQKKGVSLLYKKIDSTLRGQVGSEIESAMFATRCMLAIVTPAFPILGRTVIDGWLQVAGADELKAQHLPTLLAEQSPLNVVHIPLASLLAGELSNRIATFQHDAPLILSVDASTDEHLAQIATAALHAPFPVLMAGSGGLADLVAAQLANHFERTATPPLLDYTQSSTSKPVVLFIGSNAITTQRQVEQLLNTGTVVKSRLGVDDPQVMQQILRQGHHLLVTLRWNDPNNRTNLLPCLSMLRQTEIAGLIISGGDTARLVCDVAGVSGIQLEDELLPGLPWGRMNGEQWSGVPICTKSGRFGQDDALIKVVEWMSRQSAK